MSQSELDDIVSYTMDLLRKTRMELPDNIREIIAADLIRRVAQRKLEESERCYYKCHPKNNSGFRRNYSMPARIKNGADVRNIKQNIVKMKTREEICREKWRASFKKSINLSTILEEEVSENIWRSVTNGLCEYPLPNTPIKQNEIVETSQKNSTAVLECVQTDLSDKAEKSQSTTTFSKEESELNKTSVKVDAKAKAKLVLLDSLNNIQKQFDRLKLHFKESKELTRRRSCSNIFTHSQYNGL